MVADADEKRKKFGHPSQDLALASCGITQPDSQDSQEAKTVKTVKKQMCVFEAQHERIAIPRCQVASTR